MNRPRIHDIDQPVVIDSGDEPLGVHALAGKVLALHDSYIVVEAEGIRHGQFVHYGAITCAWSQVYPLEER